MVRLLHTADWHLGHTLHGVSRAFEHERFLSWLLEVIETEAVDGLLISGDVYDSGNPPATAQRQLFDFLVAARRLRPRLDVVVIAGNHDSPGRLEAPSPLLAPLGVRVVGSLPRRSDGGPEIDPLLVPVTDDDGEVAAWCAAVPYLRPADLPPAAEGSDPLIAGVERVYSEVLETAGQRAAGVPVVALGHCYMVGGRLSELSERRILGGHQHALPAAIFPDDLAYTALGHLHRAQAVAGREALRYAGSPLPLALDERRYPHQVVLLDLDGSGTGEIRPRRTPRAVDILRVPEVGAATPEEVLCLLEALELAELEPERWPFLDVAVRLERPEPDLRRRVEAAVEGLPLRLLRIATAAAGHGRGLGDGLRVRRLERIAPEEVFRQRWAREAEGEPPAELLEAFRELVREVEEADR